MEKIEADFGTLTKCRADEMFCHVSPNTLPFEPVFPAGGASFLQYRNV